MQLVAWPPARILIKSRILGPYLQFVWGCGNLCGGVGYCTLLCLCWDAGALVWVMGGGRDHCACAVHAQMA